MEHVKQRRTIRKYADKPIEPALLDELLETAGRASTMGNLQPRHEGEAGSCAFQPADGD